MSKIRNSIHLPSQYGDLQLFSFHGPSDQKEHIALGVGDFKNYAIPHIRIHSECLTGDLFGSAKCDCGDQLKGSITKMQTHGGFILYLRQEGRGIGLYNKIDAYKLQQEGMDTVQANLALGFKDDHRQYEVAAQMLKALGKTKVILHTNNPKKVAGLRNNGIYIKQRVSTSLYLKKENKHYLKTKVSKSGHLLSLGEQA